MFVKRVPNAIKSDDTVVPYEIGKGYRLAANSTYYVDVGIPDSSFISVHCAWDASIVLTTLNYQSSNMPAWASLTQPYSDSSGADDVEINDADTVGTWLSENPSSAYVPIAGAGATVTAMTIAVAGGAAGGAMLNISNADHRRGRMKIVVGGTGGFLRIHAHGKQA